MKVTCQTASQSVVGNSAIWDMVGDGRFVPDYRVSTLFDGSFTPGLPICPTGTARPRRPESNLAAAGSCARATPQATATSTSVTATRATFRSSGTGRTLELPIRASTGRTTRPSTCARRTGPGMPTFRRSPSAIPVTFRWSVTGRGRATTASACTARTIKPSTYTTPTHPATPTSPHSATATRATCRSSATGPAAAPTRLVWLASNRKGVWQAGGRRDPAVEQERGPRGQESRILVIARRAEPARERAAAVSSHAAIVLELVMRASDFDSDPTSLKLRRFPASSPSGATSS